MLRSFMLWSGAEPTFKSKAWELVATTVIAIIAWLLGRIYERRKTRFKNALAACKRLRTLLAEWFDGIRGAVELEKTVDDTLEKLAAFMERHHFEERTRDDFHTISLEPDCQKLAGFAHLFKNIALERKKSLYMVLERVEYSRAYEQYKDQAIAELQHVYDDFQAELDKTITSLEKKENRLWF